MVWTMLKLSAQLIGDSWFFRDYTNRWHAYVLTCAEDLTRHEFWSITHATSEDLVSWELQGEVASPPPESRWDAGCLATGSVIEHPAGGGRYLMAHTVRHAGPAPATKLLTSDDLHKWRPVGDGPAARLADAPTRWYQATGTGARSMPHFRDPWLFVFEDTLHIACTAQRSDGPPDGRGTVALLRWNGKTFEFLPSPTMPPVMQELECPQLHEIEPGRWALIFSSIADWFTPGFRQDNYLPAGTFVMNASSPMGPWGEPRSLDMPNIYAAQLLRDGGRWRLIGTVPEGAGHLSDPVDVPVSALLG